MDYGIENTNRVKYHISVYRQFYKFSFFFSNESLYLFPSHLAALVTVLLFSPYLVRDLYRFRVVVVHTLRWYDNFAKDSQGPDSFSFYDT